MRITSPSNDISHVLFTEKQIAARVEALGMDLTAEYRDKKPVMVCVLKGASFFYIDLCRQKDRSEERRGGTECEPRW